MGTLSTIRRVILPVVVAGAFVHAAQADLNRYFSHGGLVTANADLRAYQPSRDIVDLGVLGVGSSYLAGGFDVGVGILDDDLFARFGEIGMPANQNVADDGAAGDDLNDWDALGFLNQAIADEDFTRNAAPAYPSNDLFDVGRRAGSIQGGDLRYSPPNEDAAQFAAPGGGVPLTDSLNIGGRFAETDSTGHNPPHFPHMPVPGAALLGMIGFAAIGRRRTTA